MQQFVGLILAFALLMLMLKLWPRLFRKKAPLGPVLLITGLVMGLLAGLGGRQLVSAFTRVFTTFSSFQTLLVVLEIGVLGAILKRYGILEKLVRAMEQLIPSKKLLIMSLPALMGLLPVPGGAFLSAPFVDSLGGELGLTPERRAVINLYFRHFAMFILPYNTTMLAIISSLPELNIYRLIGLNLPLVAVMVLGSWFFYVRTAPTVRSEKAGGSRGRALGQVLLYLSPIYMAVVLNTALRLPLWLSLLLCILLTFFLIGPEKKDFFPSALRGIAPDTALMLIGVYFMQNVVKDLDAVMTGVSGLMVGDSILGFLLIVPLVGLAFGLSTGMNLVPLGILMPFIAGMNLPAAVQPVFAFYAMAWSFMGYFYSPFHLCQLLSCKAMGCSSGPVYREHRKMMLPMGLGAVLIFLLYYSLI